MTQPGRASLAATMTRYSPEANQKILDAAAPHLTPQQLESYRQMLAEEGGRAPAADVSGQITGHHQYAI